MFEIRAIRKRNCLYLRLYETVTVEELNQLGVQARIEADKLRAGFDMISDISSLAVLGPEVLGLMRATMTPVGKSRRVVRVVGKSSQAAVQVAKLSKEIGYEAYLAFSLEEAYRLLDGGLDLG